MHSTKPLFYSVFCNLVLLVTYNMIQGLNNEVRQSQYCEPQCSKSKRLTPCLLMEVQMISNISKEEFPDIIC